MSRPKHVEIPLRELQRRRRQAGFYSRTARPSPPIQPGGLLRTIRLAYSALMQGETEKAQEILREALGREEAEPWKA